MNCVPFLKMKPKWLKNMYDVRCQMNAYRAPDITHLN
jgi:hypothetical protein